MASAFISCYYILNKDYTNRLHVWTIEGGVSELQPYTKNSRQLRNAENGQIAFSKKEYTSGLSNTKCSSLKTYNQVTCYRLRGCVWDIYNQPWVLIMVLIVCLFACFLACFGFWDRVSLCSPGCPRTYYVDQASLEFTGITASTSPMLGLNIGTTMPVTLFFWDSPSNWPGVHRNSSCKSV